AKAFHRGGKLRKRSAPQAIAAAQVHQAEQGIEQYLVFVVPEVNRAAFLVDLHSEPKAKSQQAEHVLRLRAQEPGQHGDAGPPEQERIRRARRQVIDLADQPDVAQEKARADQMQSLAALAILPVNLS